MEFNAESSVQFTICVADLEDIGAHYFRKACAAIGSDLQNIQIGMPSPSLRAATSRAKVSRFRITSGPRDLGKLNAMQDLEGISREFLVAQVAGNIWSFKISN